MLRIVHVASGFITITAVFVLLSIVIWTRVLSALIFESFTQVNGLVISKTQF